MAGHRNKNYKDYQTTLCAQLQIQDHSLTPPSGGVFQISISICLRSSF